MRKGDVHEPCSLCKMVCSTIGLRWLREADIKRIETECGRVVLRRREGTIVDLLLGLRDDPSLEHLQGRLDALVAAGEGRCGPLTDHAVVYINSHLSRLTAFERGAALGALSRAADTAA